MDGCPFKGEVVPIRLYLSGVDLTPSYKNVWYNIYKLSLVQESFP
jgi:hypothetical protein